jgi:uncharacterized protein YqeY
MRLLERVQQDITTAMKSGERERVQALGLISSELQKAHQEAKGDEVDETAVLQRERKRRAEVATGGLAWRR